MADQPTVVIVVDDNAGFLKGVARLLAHNGIDSRTLQWRPDRGAAQSYEKVREQARI
jgi:FixJ family two-component response regulator